MLTTLLSWLALAAFAAFAVRRSLTYLRIFQQEEYDGWRFIRWVVRTRTVDTRASLGVVLAIVAGWLPLDAQLVGIVQRAILAAAFAAAAFLEANPLATGKKKLVLTVRARRILGVALGFVLLLAIVLEFQPGWVALWLVPVHFVPFALPLATLVLAPLESFVQARYWREARGILDKHKPVIVGITGSYGKTSTKHVLGHILSLHAPTLITPGSVNTAMGIARVVRERLAPQHRFFVVEMGAYGRGSIERLCALAPPALGVLTIIGKAHYERFRSVDEIATAKLELAEATRRNGGKMIFGQGAVRNEIVARYAAAHQSIVVAREAGAAVRISDVRETRDGIHFVVDWEGKAYPVAAPLHGLQQVDNVALAFAAACALGVPPAVAARAVANVPQVQHRLEVKPLEGGATLIDDAYNSNPEGFAAALSLLGLLGQPGARRILVTPGMVELGDIEDKEHAEIGRLAGEFVDVLLAVAPQRIEALISSYRTANGRGQVERCATFGEAQQWLSANLRAKDVVLLENDLPDLYEARLRL